MRVSLQLTGRSAISSHEKLRGMESSRLSEVGACIALLVTMTMRRMVAGGMVVTTGSSGVETRWRGDGMAWAKTAAGSLAE